MTKRRTWALGIVILALVGIGAWLGLRGDSGGSEGSCGPATSEEAEAANDRFFAVNATDDGYRDPAFLGNGVSEDDSGYFILVVVDERNGAGDRPACFDGVPVQYVTTRGPYSGD